MHAARYANPSRRRDLLQAGGDVDAVAEDVVALDDDVADVDADAEGNAPILGYLGGAVSHRRLHLDRAAHSIDHARELQQQAVAGGLDDAAAVAGDRRVDDLLPKGFQRRQRAALVAAHQPRVARDIGRHDGGKAALLGHSGSPASRNPRYRDSVTPGTLNGRMHVELVVPPHLCDCIVRRLLEDTRDDLVRLLVRGLASARLAAR